MVLRSYLAAGVKGAAVYTMFHHSDSELSGSPGTTPPGIQAEPHTAAFHGTSTSSDLSSSWGGVLKLGVEVAPDRRWYLDFVAQHYWIRGTAKITTQTPGIGPITRTIDQKLDPNLLGLAIGYRF